MITISGNNIGSFKDFNLKLNRFNLIFGPVDSGKSFLFRLIELMKMSQIFTLHKLTHEDPETIFSRLILVDDGSSFESKLSPEFVKNHVSNIILRRNSNHGFLKLCVKNKEVMLKINKSGNGEPIKFTNLGDLKDVLTIHIPQERPYDVISVSLSKVVQGNLGFLP